MKKQIIVPLLFLSMLTQAQIDSTLFKRKSISVVKDKLNMDAVYDRPFLIGAKTPISLGGYAEVNWQHLGTDGVSEGHQFQMRRMTLFVASSIGERIKFLSEVEFEKGGKEVAIEFASLDIEFYPLFNLRGGIILNPIGAFNQNHDGPKWEFTDRPISSTQMLPATWSNAGFGVFGKVFRKNWMFGYEVYLSGGFDNSIIDNTENKTFLPASKNNIERFERIKSGVPLTTVKIAVRNSKIGELGLSYMGGVYNTFEEGGIVFDEKRRLNVFAVDYNITLPKLRTFITGEWAWVNVGVPTTFTQQYGEKQQGGFLDVVQPILKRKMFGWKNASLNLACRFEYVDWNVGEFKETGGNIGEELWSVVPAISFRPMEQMVFRLNYRLQEKRDIFNNIPKETAGFSFGISSYF
ncbi:hypothetical protein [Tenacibaculum maritimum]|uniref:hypothetical protein n=1 Tax=Tenacibaculum maritimum TaxID=107401 RepID=UPI001E310945|nr:hypothetical protein [Tenacibaculum maritimum]MCD9610816.1 hypothetical protein [Tenacibaculum maritimum]